jgi:uncharacterized protein YqiB (DUF1249 family)
MKKRYCPDLVNHVAECDANFIRLLKLVPDMLNGDSTKDGDSLEFGIRTEEKQSIQIRICVVERFKYTTSLSIYLCGDNHSPWIRWPALQVRVYHDLNTAEVSSFEQHRHFQSRYEYPNRGMFHPDEKAQLNRFLGELLSHCLANGHSMIPLALGRI